MTTYGAIFWSIAEEVLSEDEVFGLRALIDGPLDFERLLSFDRALGGPGMHNVNRGRMGAYSIEDRDVFRPYQYCWMHFSLPDERLEWMTREIVHMCGLHLEELVERVAKGRRLTLGQGLKNPTVREVLGPDGSDRVGRFLAATTLLSTTSQSWMPTRTWRRGRRREGPRGTSTYSPWATPSWGTWPAGGSRGHCTPTPA